MDPQHTKYCPACKQVLPVGAFNTCKSRYDGLQSACRTCHGIRKKRWADANRERLKTYHAAHYQANKERYYKQSRLVIQANRERYRHYWREFNKRHAERRRRYDKEYKHQNYDKVMAWRHAYIDKRRDYFRAVWRANTARRRGAIGVDLVDYNAIYHRDRGICHICHNPVPCERLHFDHVIPLARGGTHTEGNIKVAHGRCNLRKGASV